MSETSATEVIADKLTSPNGEDLSAGTLPLQDQTLTNLGLEERRHRINLQTTVANSSLAVAVVLFMAAIAFAGMLVHMVADDGQELNWHGSLIVAAFVVPPTVILVALMRAVYGAKQEKETDSAPALAFIKECMKAVAEIFKKPH